MRLLKAILKQQTGYALPMALILLVLGGFLVVPTLALMSTSLNANRLVDRATLGLYASDSGVEDAMHKLRYTESGPPSPYPIGNVNQMQVTVQTNSLGTYTLYAGEFVELSPCSERLEIRTQIGSEPIEGTTYEYTIIVDAKEDSGPLCGGHIKLKEVGTMLPDGYSYVGGSAALYGDQDQLSTENPQTDPQDARILRWLWGGSGNQITGANPNAPVTKYQKFRITGTGNREGAYSWVEATRQNIGVVGEINGTVYIITATATKDGQTTAKVMAEVLRQGGASPYKIDVAFWEAIK